MAQMQERVDQANKKIPLWESAIEESIALKKQLETYLKAHQSDRSAAKGAIAKVTRIREKEAAAFAKASSDSQTKTRTCHMIQLLELNRFPLQLSMLRFAIFEI